MTVNNQMMKLAERLFPVCRSLTGDGVRKTLHILQEIVPGLVIHEVPSNTPVFDWTIPKEWNIRDAFIEDLDGNRIVSFLENNLHVVGYSLPVDKILSRDELLAMVYTQPDQPDAIPYVTSYYHACSGFCMSEQQKRMLTKDFYHVYIDSELKAGSLTYGEILIPGATREEIFLSTYICHPSMANNEISGPCVSVYLARWLSEQPQLRYSYRFAFVPETIGAIAYINRNMTEMKQNMIAGFNLSCVGDDRTYSYISSRYGDNLADKALKTILSFHYPEYKRYSFLERGSDERQYCAPGVDLPVCGFCRSKYGEYPEYHTSHDDLSLISPEGLGGAFDVIRKCILALEGNRYYKTNCLCEPQLGKRGLYPAISRKGSTAGIKAMADFIAYADGTNDLFDISNIIHTPPEKLLEIITTLTRAGLLE